MSDQRTRVLFVCLGNSCRSQMAEAFARALGGDVMIPASAGLAPGWGIAPDTMRAMEEKNILMRDHFPKSLRNLARIRFDLIVNMCQRPLPLEAPARLLVTFTPASGAPPVDSTASTNAVPAMPSDSPAGGEPAAN